MCEGDLEQHGRSKEAQKHSTRKHLKKKKTRTNNAPTDSHSLSSRSGIKGSAEYSSQLFHRGQYKQYIACSQRCFGQSAAPALLLDASY